MPIAFGHWSSLGLVDRADLLCLDTGCVWGGKLTAVRIDPGGRETIQVDCASQPRIHTSGRIWLIQRILPVSIANATIESLVRGAGSAYALPVAA